MAAFKLLNLLAVTTLAILTNFASSPVNALSLESRHPRHVHRSHSLSSLKKRAPARRCKATTSAVAPAQTPSGGNGGSSGGSGGGGSTPTPPPPGGGKGGLAWANPDDSKIANVLGPRIKFYYCWNPYIPDNLPGGLIGVPMMWGSKDTWSFQNEHPPNKHQYILSFNEPDQGGQSSMNPWDAAGLHRQYIQPWKYQGKTIISPATTNSPYGKEWMQQFFQACSDCGIDYVALHFYGTNPQDFINHLTDYHNAFGRGLWITEFACQSFGAAPQCSEGQVWDFMRTTVGFMEQTDWVIAHMWFGMLTNMAGVNEANRLMDWNYNLTPLGNAYTGRTNLWG